MSADAPPKFWTAPEVAQLRAVYAQESPDRRAELLDALLVTRGRSLHTIYVKAHNMGLTRGSAPRVNARRCNSWAAAEDRRLLAIYALRDADGDRDVFVAALRAFSEIRGRSYNAVKVRACMLRKKA